MTLMMTAMLIQAAAGLPATDEYVIVGRRAEQALEHCLATSCPPAEDVEASLQAAVEQFADGRYDDSIRTLRRSISRNRAHEAALPGPVSSLHATLATVSEHYGDKDLQRRSAIANVDILRRHWGHDNPATLEQEIALADNILMLGQLDTADGRYRRVAETARAAGQPLIAAEALLRRAWLAQNLSQFSRSEAFLNEAMAIAGHDPLVANRRDILLARARGRQNRENALETVAATVQPASSAPILVYAPTYPDMDYQARLDEAKQIHPEDLIFAGATSLPMRGTLRFADVGYWIRPDGRTADVELIRDNGLGQWRSGITAQVLGRRYMALANMSSDDPGVYRVDRISLRTALGSSAGTRIRGRFGATTLHVIDLTETEAMNDLVRQRMADAAVRGS